MFSLNTVPSPQVDALVRDRQLSSDRALWDGRFQEEGGGEPRLELAGQSGIRLPGQQGVLGRREAALHRLDLSGWRQHQGEQRIKKYLEEPQSLSTVVTTWTAPFASIDPPADRNAEPFLRGGLQ